MLQETQKESEIFAIERAIEMHKAIAKQNLRDAERLERKLDEFKKE